MEDETSLLSEFHLEGILFISTSKWELLLRVYMIEGYSTSLELGIVMRYLWKGGKGRTRGHLPRIKEGVL